jgi:hypothetical protein
MAADTGIEPVSLALTGRCITLMLIRKNKVERDKGVEPFSTAWKAGAWPFGQPRSRQPHC